MITIREILEDFETTILTELSSQGLAEWSIVASGNNFKETFSQLGSEDILDLLNDIYEGLPLKITLDISEQISHELEEILRTRKLTQQHESDFSDEDPLP